MGLGHRNSWRRSAGLALKRLFDVVAALIILLLTLPVLIVVAVLVYRDMGAPVLFIQRRPGRHGRVFRIYKFRTMLDARDAFGHPLPDEQRITAFGRFLRSTSLDELPQLVNVLKGDMSLVGPRPLPLEYLPLYSATQARRHEMRPGITGWAQVSGRNAITWDEKFRIDVLYVDRWSVWIDLRILLATVVAVVRRTGITQCGNATVECFRGNEYEPGHVAQSA